jgi:hypothetical protein
VFPLTLVDVTDSPTPTWKNGSGGNVILPAATTPPSLGVESSHGDALLEFVGNNGVTNTINNAPPQDHHHPTRVAISAGSVQVPPL